MHRIARAMRRCKIHFGTPSPRPKRSLCINYILTQFKKRSFLRSQISASGGQPLDAPGLAIPLHTVFTNTNKLLLLEMHSCDMIRWPNKFYDQKTMKGDGR